MAILGFIYEGPRPQQYPFYFAFTLVLFLQLLHILLYREFLTSLLVDIILLIGSGLSCFLMYVKGECDFSRFQVQGPYEVGYKEFRTKVLDNEVSVFYPVDKDVYYSQIKYNNAFQQRHGEKNLKGLGNASAKNMGRQVRLPLFMLKYQQFIKMDVVENAEVASDFIIKIADQNGNLNNDLCKPLIPIIFSHGLSSNRNWNSATYRNLASHGYIVFAIDHRDETSHYTEGADGKEIYYNNSWHSHDLQQRTKQLEIRKQEMIALIDQICDSDSLVNNELRFEGNIRIDASKLIAAGHSFGAMTSLRPHKQMKGSKLFQLQIPGSLLSNNLFLNKHTLSKFQFLSCPLKHLLVYANSGMVHEVR
ncbi:platelet-activating factor acetylhydrolase [Stylonychia lemnae]|uniref:1-alkyl-2-acetylglycerophosphocholine esterase n=1 Tax=Stylonychia lemnae TaxID=5949 RepID=A0A078AJ62_STYLE|nr:platelet-activating factor acetylhydrolase [Stylonychia lemnae]|eukprot:CDW82360.1 platelet-activating factor acetylhydrolase [Stylonychia lemnae]